VKAAIITLMYTRVVFAYGNSPRPLKTASSVLSCGDGKENKIIVVVGNNNLAIICTTEFESHHKITILIVISAYDQGMGISAGWAVWQSHLGDFDENLVA
jgi:hypothetical protein